MYYTLPKIKYQEAKFGTNLYESKINSWTDESLQWLHEDMQQLQLGGMLSLKNVIHIHTYFHYVITI